MGEKNPWENVPQRKAEDVNESPQEVSDNLVGTKDPQDEAGQYLEEQEEDDRE